MMGVGCAGDREIDSVAQYGHAAIGGGISLGKGAGLLVTEDGGRYRVQALDP